MAFHEGIPGALGGYLGVDIFFVLSGYLITDLLVAQRARRRGRMDLRGFWTRRARRLLPALAVLLVTVTATVAVVETGQPGGAPPRPRGGRHLLKQLVPGAAPRVLLRGVRPASAVAAPVVTGH